jgi:hypothetical protein
MRDSVNSLAGGQTRLRTDVISLQLAIQRGAADAQHFPGYDLVPIHLLKHPEDCRSLYIFQVI